MSVQTSLRSCVAFVLLAFPSPMISSSALADEIGGKLSFPICDLECSTRAPRACELMVSATICRCVCETPIIRGVEDPPIPHKEWPPEWDLVLQKKDGQLYKLERKSLPLSGLGNDELISQQLKLPQVLDEQAGVAETAEVIIDVLTPVEANPKGEPKTVVIKEDGTIGGYYREDGEFMPGKPPFMQ